MNLGLILPRDSTVQLQAPSGKKARQGLGLKRFVAKREREESWFMGLTSFYAYCSKLFVVNGWGVRPRCTWQDTNSSFSTGGLGARRLTFCLGSLYGRRSWCLKTACLDCRKYQGYL